MLHHYLQTEIALGSVLPLKVALNFMMSSMFFCSSLIQFSHFGRLVKAVAQVLDRQWRSLKEYTQKTLATKSKAGHVNQRITTKVRTFNFGQARGVLKHIRKGELKNPTYLRAAGLTSFLENHVCSLLCVSCGGLMS